MTKEEIYYRETGKQISGATESQMFGKPCFMINGKAFTCLFNGMMVFKLADEARSHALAFEGAVLFDPSGRGRPMKEWVQVPFEHHSKWPELARTAFDFVSAHVKK